MHKKLSFAGVWKNKYYICAMMKETPTILQKTDDICFGFALENAPVRGQIVNLGPATADEIISRHNLPEPISALLGEALALVVLAGASLKFDGRLIIELRKEHDKKDAALEFLVVEYSTDKTLRGMAKINPSILEVLLKSNKSPCLRDLFGEGFMLFTLDQGENMERYQGQVAFEGETLAQIAESYFERSEQIPTKIMLASEYKKSKTSHKEWRASGILIQQIAGDSSRGETEDIWQEANAKFKTLSREELIDSTISMGELLLRLYHENGVSSFSPILLGAKCTCNRERLVNIMGNFDIGDIEHMIETDGKIHARCEFCNTDYAIDPKELGHN